MVHEDLRPSKILTPAAFDNAIRALLSLGGSTNAVVHLIAIAGRRHIRLPLSRFDELARTTPLLVNLMPSGEYLMDRFHAAGGVPAVLAELCGREVLDEYVSRLANGSLPPASSQREREKWLLNLDCLTVTGRTLGENIAHARSFDRDVIRSREQPLAERGSLAVLTGNLAPRGAILKASAASPKLMQHRGRAVVFHDYAEMLSRINDPHLSVDANSVLVLQNAGPKGVPGFPEWGSIPIPMKLLQAGITDVVRISDSRMSGTAFGTVVLHVTPEAADGGLIGLVQDGDEIELDVASRRLQLLVDDAEIARRRAAWQPRPIKHLRGYPKLYIDHVLPADEGCDFDFLRPASDAELEWVQPVVGRS
jgi:dihydroxy-acid dehydratase